MKQNVHGGHRKRMRDKFMEYGPDAFATYELLEMLLYSNIRYKDTNPLSKAILKSCGGISGVLNSKREDFLKIEDVGEKSADLLYSLCELSRLISEDKSESYQSNILDNSNLGKIFVNYFRGVSGYAVALMSIDNTGKVISIETLYNLDYQSGAVRPQAFIDCALKNGASRAVIAHCHPNFPAVVTEGDRATNKAVVSALSSINVEVLEHFLVCGDEYTPFMNKFDHLMLSANNTGWGLGRLGGNSSLADRLLEIFYPYAKIEREGLLSMFEYNSSLEHFCSHDATSLVSKLGIDIPTAILIKIMQELSLRGVTDSFKSGTLYSEGQIAEYLKAKFYAMKRETVIMLSFDEKGRYIATDNFGSGTVNYSSVIPRMTMERALARGASSIYVAHNHPGGYANPSNDDVGSIHALNELYASSNIDFKKAVIVSGKKAAFISCPDFSMTVL